MTLKFSSPASQITEGIRVNVRTAFLPAESSPAHEHYVFAYQIQIINESPYRVQLLSRSWQITDGIGRKKQVSGEGVIGEQPVLAPGEVHEYVSGSNFSTPLGKMDGYYTFRRMVDGVEFKVKIPAFPMFASFILN